MAEQNTTAQRPVNTVTQIKNLISQDSVKKKFGEVLGQKAHS